MKMNADPSIIPVHNYRDFTARQSISGRLRTLLRDQAVTLLSLGHSISKSSGWIRFPYYHHVFDDERVGFARQLDYLRQFGDFISLSDAIAMLDSKEPIEGRYFCITFDDGFKNNLTNAVPILVEKRAPAAFFLTTDYIDRTPEIDKDLLLQFYSHRQTLMEFLSWQDCREMIAAGMEIGSHTMHHARLAQLDEASVSKELTQSKATIESNLGVACPHFCAPFGIPDRDFTPTRDPDLVRDAGYQSMLTTDRGPMYGGGDPFHIRRDHMLANWGPSQLRYFLSKV